MFCFVNTLQVFFNHRDCSSIYTHAYIYVLFIVTATDSIQYVSMSDTEVRQKLHLMHLVKWNLSHIHIHLCYPYYESDR